MRASIRLANSKIGLASSKSPFINLINHRIKVLHEMRRLSQLVETISKRRIPDHQKNVIFEMTVEDQNEEDVEVPYVMLKLQK